MYNCIVSLWQIREEVVYNIMRVGLLITILGLTCAIDLQLLMEYENTLHYIIHVVNNTQLHEFNYQHYKKCVSLQCCVCGQSFKSQAASAIHTHVHHKQLLKYDNDLAIIFDELIPSQQRYEFCNVYLRRWFGDELGQRQIEEVCYVSSWNLFRREMWIDVLKYILYIVLGLVAVIYYSQVLKPWK